MNLIVAAVQRRKYLKLVRRSGIVIRRPSPSRGFDTGPSLSHGGEREFLQIVVCGISIGSAKDPTKGRLVPRAAVQEFASFARFDE